MPADFILFRQNFCVSMCPVLKVGKTNIETGALILALDKSGNHNIQLDTYCSLTSCSEWGR